jgi:tetratricopeptide (TPR) repeat protein
MQNNESPPGFVRTMLPWIVGAGALLLYLVTLNHWVNLKSLQVVAKVAGWDWALPVQWPLFFALTWPIRLLPASIQALALNAFAAICSALTLVLLARSVALLPHDRTHEQRQRERSEFSLLSIRLSWLPPLLAVLVCGLQLTFWENATAVTGESLNLLLFAYIIRCLLEYRIDHRDSWLLRLALVYGLGITNDWGFIGFLPGFLISVVWIKGVSFFKNPFLWKFIACGAVGLLFYLVLPTIWAFKSDSEYGFWAVLKENLSRQKLFLTARQLRFPALIFSLTALMPVFIMGVRWPSSFGETSAVGSALTNFMFRTIQLVLLVACLGVAFDYKISPRIKGVGVPFLTFYYLGALAIGYFSGYALLVFTAPPRKGWHQPGISKLLNPLIRALVILLSIAVPAGLVYRNWPAIKASNGTMLRSFASTVTEQLPKGLAYLLSDAPAELLVLEGYLRETSATHNYVLVNTKSMQSPRYQKALHKHYGTRWPEIKDIELAGPLLDPGLAQAIITTIGRTNQLVYLQPSFGYYFERFYAEPKGPIYLLHNYESNQVLPPALTEQQIKDNERLWSSEQQLLQQIERFSRVDSPDAHFLAGYYARGLNTWGVYLQRANKVKEAGDAFERAGRINTNNISAQINAEFNKTVQAGKPQSKENIQILEERTRSKPLDTTMLDDGDIDEPFICFRLGLAYSSQNLYRQCVQEISRTVYFQPTNLLAHLSLTRAYVYGGWPDEALQQLARTRQSFPDFVATNDVELIAIESSAWFAKNDPARAEILLKEAERKHPDDPLLMQSLYALYSEKKDYTNAIAVLDKQIKSNPTNSLPRIEKAELYVNREQYGEALKIVDDFLARDPNNVAALVYKCLILTFIKDNTKLVQTAEKAVNLDPENVQAQIYLGIGLMEQKQFDKGIEAFARALDKDGNNVAALQNRAIANLQANHLDEAARDYSLLEEKSPGSYVPFYGLAEIAEKRKNTREAIKNYELYLKLAPTNGGPEFVKERQRVEQRLKELKSDKS